MVEIACFYESYLATADFPQHLSTAPSVFGPAHDEKAMKRLLVENIRTSSRKVPNHRRAKHQDVYLTELTQNLSLSLTFKIMA